MARNRANQRNQRREKIRQMRINKIVDKVISSEKIKDQEYGWQYVCGIRGYIDKTPLEAIVNL